MPVQILTNVFKYGVLQTLPCKTRLNHGKARDKKPTISCAMAIVAVILLIAAGCANNSKPVLYFTMAGSNTIGDTLAQTLVIGYLMDVLKVKKGDIALGNPGGLPDVKQITATVNGQRIKIVIRDSGTHTGFVALENHSADICMASRKVDSGETKLLTGGFGAAKSRSVLNEHVIALDGIAVIANPQDNLQPEPDLARLKSIFSGNEPAFCLSVRDSNSGTTDGFKHMVGLKKFGADATAFNNNKLLIQNVARNSCGVGFVSYSLTVNAPQVKVVPLHAGAGIPALLPNPVTIKDESYALCRELNLYTYTKNILPVVDSFISYVESPLGQEIVQSVGFVNLEIETDSPIDRAGDTAIYTALIRNDDKLSADVRFQSNSFAPDSRAATDIVRIVRYLNLEENKRKRVILVGFSDSIGNKQANEKIALKRAMAVKKLLMDNNIGAEPGYEISVYALGKQRPVRNNATEDERAKNRRVELWITR